MYDIFYNFILDNLFNSTALANCSSTILGVSFTLNEWLAHTTTIILIALLVVFGVVLVKWIFKLVGGLFLLK